MKWLFEARSIRSWVVMSMLALLPPAAGMAAWLLAGEERQARAAAAAQVNSLAAHTAADVQRTLARASAVLTQLAARPRVKSMDTTACDPVLGEYAQVDVEFAALGVRGARGELVCANGADPLAALPAERLPWFEGALRAGGFRAGDAFVLPAEGGRWVAVLTQPVTDAAGRPIGLLTLPLDLVALSAQLFADAPDGAILAVLDARGTVLLRSTDGRARIGRRGTVQPEPASPPSTPAAASALDGTRRVTGRDGVERLVAYVTLPGIGWRVVAALPEAELLADYRVSVRRTATVGIAVVLIGIALAWRLSRRIAQPIAGLAETARAVAAGQTSARAIVEGPVEVATVARQFNGMLDAHDAARRALAESEQRYRTLVDWSPEALSVHRGGRVLFVNRATVEMLGAASADELVGHPSIEIVHPAFREGVEGTVQSALDDDRAIGPHEQRFVRRDGATVDVEVQGTRILYNGQPALIASMRDIGERKRVEAALRDREAQLQRLFAVQDRVQEEERRRIARELHDDLQQTLAAVRMNLRAAGEQLAADPQRAAALLAEVDQLAGAAIVSTRRIVNDLRPPMLEDLGLVPALETLAARFRQHSGIACDVQADDDGSVGSESPAVATSLYRVAQESLNNVLKHADASQVTMRLADAGDDHLTLSIHDDGVGFAPAAAAKPLSFGLLGMNERIRSLGGTLRIDSRPGGGTTIEVTMPVRGPGSDGAGTASRPAALLQPDDA